MERVISIKRIFLTALAAALLSVVPLPLSHAATTPGNFSLQVSPSPLVATVKPGEPKELDLKIHNTSTGPEDLKIETKAFKLNDKTGEIDLNTTAQAEIAPWVSYSNPTFTVNKGEWFTQKVKISLPQETGFSYSFIIQISRQNPTKVTSGSAVEGSVAVFTLINVDKPGATKQVELVSFEPSQQVYEYLPATLNIRLKNTGNTIVQPYGNVYIQHKRDDKQPITTLPVNTAQAYLLPGSERTLRATWTDGFPYYQSATGPNGTTVQKLTYDIDNLKSYRMGRYTAKVVAVYNDGTRDVPITGEVTFWVLPWKAVLVVLGIIIAIILLFRWFIRSRTEKAVKRALGNRRVE